MEIAKPWGNPNSPPVLWAIEWLIPKNALANGVTKEQFEKALDKMVDRVYDDQCTTANPRQPYLEEIRQLLIDQF